MKYFVEATAVTPLVNFDDKTGVFELRGKSFWENSDSLYDPILKWLDEVYLPNPCQATVLTIELDYFNTSTAKMLLNIFKKLEVLNQSGKTAEIIWRYNELDEDLEEAAEDYQRLTSLKISLDPFKP